jgi:nucleoside-diphosphate-sugar epimerase
MRILLTGASGLIGRQIGAELFPHPVELVRATGSPRRGVDGENYCADLSNRDEAAALVRHVRPTHIIHAAWETRPPTYWEDVANLKWLEATMAMASAFAEVGGSRFVQVGSCAEYDWADGLCIEETTSDRPATRYGKAKLASFRAIQSFAHNSFEAVEARFFFLYGPGERPERFVPSICLSHLRGQAPELSSGRQQRDFLHSSDAARALIALACSSDLGGIVNIGSGVASPLSAIAELLAEIAGASETGLGRIADRPADPPLLAASIERIRALGWKPRLSLREGLASTFDWWRDEMEKLPQ